MHSVKNLSEQTRSHQSNNSGKSTCPSPILNTISSNPETFFSQWDMQCNCIPMFPVFRHISNKLAQRKLYVAFITADRGNSIIPAWPVPRPAQIILAKIVRKACAKFHLVPKWMTTMAANTAKQNSEDIFDTDTLDSYLVRRSLVQHEVVFGGDGLMLLSIDHVYTFKRFLNILSKSYLTPRARPSCLDSCVEILRRINKIYTGHKPLQGYFLRVYDEIEIGKEILNEVCSSYREKYGASVTLEVMQDDSDGHGDAPREARSYTPRPSFEILPEIVESPLPVELPQFIAEIDSSVTSPWGPDRSSPPPAPDAAAVSYPETKPTRTPALAELPAGEVPTSTALCRSNALCHRCREIMTSSTGLTQDITTILSPEWEQFREVGMGLHLSCVK